MRTISRLSTAFLLMDLHTRDPVTDATILVDGKRCPCVRKNDGHVLFLNLPPTGHTYTISAPGYCTQELSLPVVPENEPEIILMNHTPDWPGIARVPHYRFRFKKGGKPLRESVRVTLLNPTGSLRAVANVPKKSRFLPLGGTHSNGLLYQPYHPKGMRTDVLFVAYDGAAEQYELQQPMNSQLKQGTLLQPVWNLIPDCNGTAILPYMGLFFQGEEPELQFEYGGKTTRRTTKLPVPEIILEIGF